MNLSGRRVLSGCLAMMAIVLFSALPASAAADVTYTPSSGWNNQTIYLSTACHDGNYGVPGGPCIDNLGCSGYSENQNSDAIATNATLVSGYGGQQGLLHRGFRVIIGQGTLNENVARSNAANARLHVPIHSNAQGSGVCGGSTSPSANGTHVLYVSSGGSQCSTQIKNSLGPLSPGTNDKIVYRTDLGELNNTNAVACYVEAEFHSWPTGATWLKSNTSWPGAIALGIDTYLGFP